MRAAPAKTSTIAPSRAQLKPRAEQQAGLLLEMRRSNLAAISASCSNPINLWPAKTPYDAINGINEHRRQLGGAELSRRRPRVRVP